MKNHRLLLLVAALANHPPNNGYRIAAFLALDTTTIIGYL